MSLLEINGLHKSFGGILALRGVDLAVDAGQIVALIGPNGAGKTTLFNVISGVYRADAGTIVFDGKRIDRVPPHEVTRRGICRTFQIASIFREMSVAENVMLGRHSCTKAQIWQVLLRLSGAKKEEKEIQANAAALLEKVGMGKFSNDPASTLPHGRQRFLELARALASDPKLLLLDEPVSGLNAQEAESVHEMVRSLRDQGITIFLVEHNMRTVMTISDKVIVLNFGQKISEGTTDEVKKDPKVIEAYLGASQ